jgi:hypothetical protein
VNTARCADPGGAPAAERTATSEPISVSVIHGSTQQETRFFLELQGQMESKRFVKVSKLGLRYPANAT